jgi:hypothetical protein
VLVNEADFDGGGEFVAGAAKFFRQLWIGEGALGSFPGVEGSNGDAVE